MEARELAAVQGLGEKQRGHVLMTYEQRAKKNVDRLHLYGVVRGALFLLG